MIQILKKTYIFNKKKSMKFQNCNVKEAIKILKVIVINNNNFNKRRNRGKKSIDKIKGMTTKIINCKNSSNSILIKYVFL